MQTRGGRDPRATSIFGNDGNVAAIEAKLAKGRELFPEGYRTLTGITALLGPLRNPDDHVPPMGDPSDDKRTSLRFSTASIDYQRAKAIMRDEVLPHLVKSAAESKVR